MGGGGVVDSIQQAFDTAVMLMVIFLCALLCVIVVASLRRPRK